MLIKNQAVLFVSIILAFSWPTAALSQRPRMDELVSTDGSSQVAAIQLNERNLMFEPADGSMSFLFTDEALFTINHKEKTYSVQGYDGLQAMLKRKSDEIATSARNAGTGPDIGFRLTEQDDTIAGVRVRKLIKMNANKTEVEYWVSNDLLPTKLRELGERIRAVLPADYYNETHGNPGLLEVIILYGVPLKIVVDDNRRTYQARVLDASNSTFSFQVPAGYMRVFN